MASERKTPYSVVYLHGFSATRQETAPLAECVADSLGANLFETRLAGHGREREPLADVRAEDWLHDAAEALAIAARLGERVIVIGTSTGATLAVGDARSSVNGRRRYDRHAVAEFCTARPSAAWLTRPAGPLARATAGRRHAQLAAA